MWGLLILLVAATASAQPPKTIFPSDSQDPKQSGGAALLEAVCPGRVVVGKEIQCRVACPESSGFAGGNFEWILAAVTHGHFLSPQSDEAVLSMTGCEPHSENWGGTILLTRREQKWTMLWYKAGIETSQCHKVKLRDLREIPVCLGSDGGQGIVQTELFVEDLLSPTPSLMAAMGEGFFTISDTTDTCGWMSDDVEKPDPLIRAYIEKVDFRDIKGGVAAISVTAAHGEQKMTREDVDICTKQSRSFLPQTKRYQADFTFEGGSYRRSSVRK
jgi:hypothetical protein